MSIQELYKHKETTECARAAVRENIAIPMIRKSTGRIVELVSSENGTPTFSGYANAEAYEARQSDGNPDELGDIGLWIFGPERSENPGEIYRSLSDSLRPDAEVIIASEVPWPGKILSSEEYAEYTSEETTAAFVRAGFVDIERIVEGPFFRIWRAKKSQSKAYISLATAEAHLNDGDYINAEIALNSLTEQLDSALAVREYALLVAACHDLAGRQIDCMEALSDALSLDPRCARAMAGLGRIAALRGELDSAFDFFGAALRCEPALVAGLHGMAVVLEAKGELQGAYRQMTIASDLRPKNDKIMAEASRLGNTIGEFDDVTRFINHRLSMEGIPTGISKTTCSDSSDNTPAN